METILKTSVLYKIYKTKCSIKAVNLRDRQRTECFEQHSSAKVSICSRTLLSQTAAPSESGSAAGFSFPFFFPPPNKDQESNI